MMPSLKNAIILAAGTSSRFVPLSSEKPKGLLEVRGEILVERQIRQLKEAGINDITVIIGYKAEMFQYLRHKFGVDTVLNEDYQKYNNISSLIKIVDRLSNTYICSSDNYFPQNVFLKDSDYSYYSSLYAEGETNEYCISSDGDDNITRVSVGGRDSWYMIGHVYFSEEFSRTFRDILKYEYEKEKTRHEYWEDVYIRYINNLPKMKIRKYGANDIKEFDTIDELRTFDASYVCDTRSSVLKRIAKRLNCGEEVLHDFKNIPHQDNHLLFSFLKDNIGYRYDQQSDVISEI